MPRLMKALANGLLASSLCNPVLGWEAAVHLQGGASSLIPGGTMNCRRASLGVNRGMLRGFGERRPGDLISPLLNWP